MNLPRNKWFWILAPIGALFFIAILLTFVKSVDARTESQTVDIVSSSNDLVVNYAYPEFAQIDQSFDVGMNAFSSTTGLTITINPGADWTYNGCSFISETTAGSLTGIKSARVRILMVSETCSATATVQATLTVGGAVQSQAFITMNIFQDTTKTIPTSFEALTGTTSWEFFALIMILFIGIMIWSRSTDYAIRYCAIALTFIPGLIWLSLYQVHHLEILMLAAILTFITGVYMAVRAAIDAFEERQENRSL